MQKPLAWCSVCTAAQKEPFQSPARIPLLLSFCITVFTAGGAWLELSLSWISTFQYLRQFPNHCDGGYGAARGTLQRYIPRVSQRACLLTQTGLWKLNRRPKDALCSLEYNFWRDTHPPFVPSPTNLHLQHMFFFLVWIRTEFLPTVQQVQTVKTKITVSPVIFVIFLIRSSCQRGTVELLSLWIWGEIKNCFSELEKS